MNQIEQLNDIMAKFREYAKDKNGVFTSKSIYDAFIGYGINPNLVKTFLDDDSKKQIFSKLIEKEDAGNRSLSGGSSHEEWIGFYTNTPRDGLVPKPQWKVYIPINPAYYSLVSTSIIEFLCENGIFSNSKLSFQIRSDSMIVNLSDEDDVTRLNDYIDKNKVLKSCLGTHHPFIPDFNGIGVVHTYDTEDSYTERLSECLAKFLNYCKQHDRLDWISVEDFLISLKNSLDNGVANNPNEIMQIIEHMNVILYGSDFVFHQTENIQHMK